MFLPQVGVHDVEGSFTTVEAVFDEGAKHPVLLVGAVEEGADMTLAAQTTPRKLHGMVLGSHVSPHRRGRREHGTSSGAWLPEDVLGGSTFQGGANALEQQFVVEWLGQELHSAGPQCLHPHACVAV